MLRLSKDQNGMMNALLIPLILAVLFLLGAVGFGFWAFNSRQDYKNNVDQKISKAVADAQAATQQTDQAKFDEEAKKPLKPYNGPEAYGSIVIKYPKNWSAYVDTTGNSVPVDGFFQPDFVPGVSNQTQTYALRMQVVQTSYDQVLTQFNSLVKGGLVTVKPYKPANVSNVTGVRIDGQVVPKKQGSMIVLPLRDKTLKLWTEASQFETDYNNNILPNFTFSP